MSLFATTTLVVVFSIALGSKLRSRSSLAEFLQGLDQWHIRSARNQYVVGMAALLAEGGAILALLAGPPAAPWRFLPALVVLALFTLAIGVAARGRTLVACHCFGSIGPVSPAYHLVVNAVLITCALCGALSTQMSTPGIGPDVLSVGGGLLAGFATILAEPVLQALRLPSVSPDRESQGGSHVHLERC